MIAATFFDILGIDPNAPDRASVAKGLWPQDLLSTTQGMHLQDDDATQVLVNALQASLSFTNVRPGVDAQAFFDAGAVDPALRRTANQGGRDARTVTRPSFEPTTNLNSVASTQHLQGEQ